MFKTMLLASLMMSFLSSCAITGPETDTFCALARPIYLDKADDLTANTGRAILSHDETGRVKCGWERI